MAKNPFMRYYLEYIIHFMNRNKLKSIGTYTLYVKEKRAFSVDNNSHFGIDLITRDQQYEVLMMISNKEFGRVRRGMKYGEFSIVSTPDGRLRAAKALTPDQACREVSKNAKFQMVVLVVALLLFLMSALSFILIFISGNG